MTDQPLGRLERVELRDIWVSEATSFTPWLARPENLAVLGEALNIDLELEAQERAVGPFRADLLCKDVDTDRWVLIEKCQTSAFHARFAAHSGLNSDTAQCPRCANKRQRGCMSQANRCRLEPNPPPYFVIGASRLLVQI